MDRSKIRRAEFPASKTLVLDEIHKFSGWRNLTKGLFDKKKSSQQIIVTGSARLDHYRRGGDSLLGRCGFPEAYFKSSERFWKLWQNERLHRVVDDDIRSLENLKTLDKIELLAEALLSRVVAPLCIRNLAGDLNCNPMTAEHWTDILEKVYYVYRISPFGSPKIRAVKKEQKLYFWDWSSVESEGARFENFVASHLLKYCHFLEDSQGDKMELRFLRDTDRREIDFVVLKNKYPEFAVECKTGEKSLSRHIHYFKERTNIPRFYQVHLGTKDYEPETGIRVLPFAKFYKLVKIP